jgi:hypothetical protein
VFAARGFKRARDSSLAWFNSGRYWVLVRSPPLLRKIAPLVAAETQRLTFPGIVANELRPSSQLLPKQ